MPALVACCGSLLRNRASRAKASKTQRRSAADGADARGWILGAAAAQPNSAFGTTRGLRWRPAANLRASAPSAAGPALCSKRHMARMHRKPHRHPRESGDLCRMGPRFRGDDDPLWRLLHNAVLICVESCLLWRRLRRPPREHWKHRGTRGFARLALRRRVYRRPDLGAIRGRRQCRSVAYCPSHDPSCTDQKLFLCDLCVSANSAINIPETVSASAAN